jgi:hypothetical protein
MNQSRAVLPISLGAAAGAFAVAAMISATAAPTAHADTFTDVINAVDGDFTAGQDGFTTAATDFSGGELAPGLAALFDGVDDDSIVAPENFLIGTVELATNESVSVSSDFGWTVPASFSDAISGVESFAGLAEGDFSIAATDLSGADYGAAFIEYAYALNLLTIDPIQELLLGAAASF